MAGAEAGRQCPLEVGRSSLQGLWLCSGLPASAPACSGLALEISLHPVSV